MCTNDDFVQVKFECDDSNFSNSFTQDEEQCDTSQLGEPTIIKTMEGGTASVQLRPGNKLLYASGKFFCIEHTTNFTDYQKENTGIVCICHHCGARIKGSLKVSSNFICHLKNKHPEVYQDFLKQKSAHSASYIRAPKVSNDVHRSSPYPTPTPILNNILHNNEKQEQFHHNVLKFLVATNQSFDVVVDPNFSKLFEFLSFPVQMRPPDYYEKMVKDACDYKRIELFQTFSSSRAFVCNSVDAWSYRGCSYMAVACHWIDEHYQRQASLLTCRRAKRIDDLSNVQSEILQRYGITSDNITASTTSNVHSFQNDFIQFGITKEVFAQDHCFVSDDDPNSLKFLSLEYQHLIKLDILKLNEIWGQNFLRKLNDNLKVMHRSVMEKCSNFWLISLSKDFQLVLQTILSEPMTRPNILNLTSLYQSIKQLLSHSDKLDQIFCLMSKPGFTPVELEYLAELQELFEPLSAAFAFLDMPQNNYYGCFLPTLVTLKWKLTRLYNSNKLVHLQETLATMKEELLKEFKDYYDLNESKSEAIIAALTYPPVKTRFAMGLKDNTSSYTFQLQNILRKYGSEYHVVEEQKGGSANNFAFSQQGYMDNSSIASTDFFDFGDTADSAVDAEELKNVNISKKEFTELMAELFGDLNEGVSLESIELETPQKFLLNYQEDALNTPNTLSDRVEESADIGQQLNCAEQSHQDPASQPQSCAITSSNNIQHDMSFHPDVMSTPSTHDNCYNNDRENVTLIPVAMTTQNETCSTGSTVTIPPTNLNSDVEFIALPVPGQPNHFQLAKIVNNADSTKTPRIQPIEESAVSSEKEVSKSDICYKRPYETNYTAQYISVRRHAMAEFKEKFDESLRQAQVNQISSTTTESELGSDNPNGFTKYQYDLFQQQMRIHVQMLTQTYVQTYCHPVIWNLAKKPKEMLMELKAKSENNNNFKAWNLDMAIHLIEKWQQELDEDTEENRQLMKYMHREIEITKHNGRQIPRFPSRILECFLQSQVFMYPEYLPRMPFSPKVQPFETFSPFESYLIAMGLEKHITMINERKERIHTKSTPLHVACRRMTKDIIYGKSCRPIMKHIMRLRNAEDYNPIKYYFEHNKAPPVEYTPIIGFENNTVLPPKDRFNELPLVFQKYLEEKNTAPPPSTKVKKCRRKTTTDAPVKASEQFRNSFFEFVREAVGEEIAEPENSEEADQQVATVSAASADSIPYTPSKKRYSKQEPKTKRGSAPHNVTINVNYVFGASPIATCTASSSVNTSHVTANPLCSSNNNSVASLNESNNTTLYTAENQSIQYSAINQSITNPLNVSTDYPDNNPAVVDTSIISYNFDVTTQRLEPCILTNENITEDHTINADFTTSSSVDYHAETKSNKDVKENIVRERTHCWRKKSTRFFSNISKLNRYTLKRAVAYREKRKIKQRCEDLITAYGTYLNTLQLRFEHAPIIQHYYRKFLALKLYTNLLRSLKEICRNHLRNSVTNNSTNQDMTSSGNSPSGVKRTRNSNTEDESSPSSQRMARKINRQEENFRHMLLPDTPEEANRKDAIYAFNFYEKVEEAFRSSNRADDCKKFNTILKSFDPKTDKVSDLYYKLEKLFLPEHPELAQVFLTFLLPSDAAEIGKFFEHFMINNMTTFINKLNVYFNKQPAQIRKIYNCLNELADDPDVTIKKLETKIVPLLKGNQFLIDWFMQQFPQGTPPERLLGTPEHILNLKEQQSNKTGEYVETLTDILDSPVNDNQAPSCQLRYINGRIFYGSKMLLPAKLSFMATTYKAANCANSRIISPPAPPTAACVHAIKDHGDTRLHSAFELATATATSTADSNDDHDKSEEDDTSKALIIDTTAEDDDSCSSFEPCDENTLKAHALRLNPSYYSSSCYSTNATSTPNLNSNFQTHHPNAKKTSLNFSEPEPGSSAAGKTSPRKYSSQNQSLNSPSSTISSTSSSNAREKRKSPSKKTKSPLNNAAPRSVRTFNQPMVVIHENSSAIQCAKRLKCLVEEPTEERSDVVEEPLDSKEHINIVARTKSSMRSTPSIAHKTNCTATNDGGRSSSVSSSEEVKQENTDDLEFLPEHPSITRSPFPALKMDTDSNEEDVATSSVPPKAVEAPVSTIKNSTVQEKSNENTTTAWTRDEDKVILIEMKLGSQNREELYQRIAEKLTQRTMSEIIERHMFLMDFLSKLQKK